MKKIFLMVMLVLLAAGAAAQSPDSRKAARQAAREVREKKRQALDSLRYNEALQALNNRYFVMKASRVVFRRGQTAMVDPSTNFVSLQGTNAVVQVGFDVPSAGANGLGGITVEGTASDITMKTDKKGYVFFNMNVVGLGISATVDLTLYPNNNDASVSVTPNYNNNRITFEGQLTPYGGSGIIEGSPY